ncbi:MAG: hypothetical protein AMJ91_02235 [candidate division Zixibacteria bacterium SM23_73_3]|nr:MAG: hypothetical protein AMJ91_02235 [candidate division Zixibacteria bacterium SM23_73_3]
MVEPYFKIGHVNWLIREAKCIILMSLGSLLFQRSLVNALSVVARPAQLILSPINWSIAVEFTLLLGDMIVAW